MLSPKFLTTLALALVIVGGLWLLSNRERLEKPGDVWVLAQETLGDWVPDSAPAEPGAESSPVLAPTGPLAAPVSTGAYRMPAAPQVTGVLRVAAFRVQPDVARLPSAEPTRLLAEICRQYDILILQNVDRHETTWFKQLTDQMNVLGGAGSSHWPTQADGRRADYVVISDRQQRPGETQTAIVFNRQTVQLDHARWYLVADPDQIFQRPPMVAWFRARGVPPEQAFTFSLASVEISPTRPDQELVHLGTLFRAIRNDGRGEDDVILMGNFQSDDRGLETVRQQAGLTWVVSNEATQVGSPLQTDNVLFNDAATVEFTGRGGVLNFPLLYQIQQADALAVAEHLPVWAEFSILENGNPADPPLPGRVAWETDRRRRADERMKNAGPWRPALLEVR